MREFMVAEFMRKYADDLLAGEVPDKVIGKYHPPCFTQAHYCSIELIGLFTEIDFINIKDIYFANPGKRDNFLL